MLEPDDHFSAWVTAVIDGRRRSSTAAEAIAHRRVGDQAASLHLFSIFIQSRPHGFELLPQPSDQLLRLV